MTLARGQASLRRKRAGAKGRARIRARVAYSGRNIMHYLEDLSIALARGNGPKQCQCAEEAMCYQHGVVMADVIEGTAQDNEGMQRQLSEIEERLSGDHVDWHARDCMLARAEKMLSTAHSGGRKAIAVTTVARILRVKCKLHLPRYSRKPGCVAKPPIEQRGRGPDIKAKRAARVSNRRKSAIQKRTCKRTPASSSRRAGNAKLRGGGAGPEPVRSRAHQ